MRPTGQRPHASLNRLVERKPRLRRVLPDRSAFVLYLEHVDGRGRDLFAEVCRRDLEGIVAKWKRGAYRAAPLSSWVKVKNPTYTQAEGRRELFERRSAAF